VAGGTHRVVSSEVIVPVLPEDDDEDDDDDTDGEDEDEAGITLVIVASRSVPIASTRFV
jgi:hypothetical protein